MEYVDAKERDPDSTDEKLLVSEDQIVLLGAMDDEGMNRKEWLTSIQASWGRIQGLNVTYKAVTSRGFVISGRFDGVIAYVVAELHDDKVFVGMWWYPVSRKLEMDPVITRFYKSFTVR